MNKKAIVIGMVALFGVVIATKRKGTAKESYAMYNRERLVQTAETQLKGIDIDAVRSKAPFIIERSIEEIQQAIRDNELTYEQLTAFYLDRILTFDQVEQGINGISEINPAALDLARACDRMEGEHPILFGLPVTVKENINTADMVTSAGTHILRHFIPSEDADVVKRLKAEGAIIFAKTNLSELANYMSPKMPSGYSSKHGQTINPYQPLKLSPLGSSSGAGTSITTNIGVLALGTETTGSIVAPAAYTSTVGFKPSIGRTAGEGVFPLASSLDVVGPIAKNVTDALHGYNAIVASQHSSIDVSTVRQGKLSGQRIGMVRDKSDMAERAVHALKAAGAEVIMIDFDTSAIDNVPIIDAEFAGDVEHFAERYHLPFRTLSEVVDYNRGSKKRAKYGQGHIRKAANIVRNQDVIDTMIQRAAAHYDALTEQHQLDSIAYIDYDGTLVTAVAGYPEISIPLGLDRYGAPHGLTLTAGFNADIKVLQLGYAFEQYYHGRYCLTDNELSRKLFQSD